MHVKVACNFLYYESCIGVQKYFIILRMIRIGSIFTVFLVLSGTLILSQTAEEYFLRGNGKSEKGDYSGAIADYSKSIELEPNFSGTYNNRANVYFTLKRYDEAIADYSKAIELKPDYASAFYNRGLSFYSLKRYDEAIKDFTSAIYLKKNNGWLSLLL